MRLAIILSMLHLITFGIIAQENKKNDHPIDIAYKKCLDNPNNQTTIGMVDCAIKARGAWEVEVEKYYKLLLTKVSEETKPLLRKSQETWKEYKKSEFDFSNEMYLSMGGTIWQIVAADNKTEFVKQRALLLKSHYENLTEKDE